MAENSVVMTPWKPAVPAMVQAELDTLVGEIKAKKLHPFQGEVKKQDGTVVVPAGSVISDADLLQMNYYVAGVDSAIPG
jgi:simple sugar transport system substrate-binding protein